jgi:cytochrome d ubiquinol oxidase subunit II
MYLAVYLFVWLLLGRGLAIELRGHLRDPLWRSFWDRVFVLSSLGLAVLLGAAGGNVVRGFVLDEQGDFSLALFDDFSPHTALGLLDSFTLTSGVYVLLTLTLHGARFLAWKQPDALGERADRLARTLSLAVAAAWLGLVAFTAAIRPDLGSAALTRPLSWLAVVLALVGLVLAARSNGRTGFIGSSLHLAGVLVATASSVYPTLLFARVGHSLSALDSAAPASSLRSAITWYPLGLALALGYVAALFRFHRGKVEIDPESAADDDHVSPRASGEGAG